MKSHNESYLIRHGPCAKCGSRDNRAEYSDGHFYCFGCQDYTPSTERRKMTHNVKPPLSSAHEYYFNHLESVVPPGENRLWLKRYISDAEIDRYFCWHPLEKRHVFLKKFPNESFFLEMRSVDPTKSKTQTYGEKPLIILGDTAGANEIVIVEDLVSAIKISRQYVAIPMFGSYISRMSLAQALERVPTAKKFIFWMDADKWITSMSMAKTMGYLLPTEAVYTQRDPKEHTDEEIEKVVENLDL